jgi:Glyoxalase-like domain
MAVSFQLVIDCTDPDRLARFWAAALGYELEPPPAGFASWDDYWRDVGVPEEDLGIGEDRICDPGGAGPRIWFQVVPEHKTVKNRLHLDICASGVQLVGAMVNTWPPGIMK